MALEALLVVLVLAAVVIVVSAPLRSGRAVEERETAEVRELEAARELKYREIREAELDFRTGKLSDDDYRVLDRSLRSEAIEILHALDRAQGRPPDAG
jgi:type II secretory pathway component PulM